MPSRVIKATYSSLTGTFPSRKMNRPISWESSLERDLYYLLENDPAVTSYEEQPIEIIRGKRKYTPDCMAVVEGESFIFPYLKPGNNLIEVKYREDLYFNWKKHKPRLKLGLKESRENGWFFKIITDYEIRGQFLENIKKIDHQLRRVSQFENEFREALIDAMKQVKICTLDQLLALCFRNQESKLRAMPVIWRMLGDQTLGIDMYQKITPHSEVWLME
ncbi:TnsA endonuclease [Kangiella koreensis DSM 16069]|uniref:TnsA endonuclease n=2 Tax=Kangiella TaxID=261963 RepID=C7R624_KANKD|nr:TnsA endonuclease [Kangiella koreensis DSM 16069]